LIERYIGEDEKSDDGHEQSREDSYLKRFGSKLWPSSTVSFLQQTTKYWSRRAWHWIRSREDFEDIFVEDVDNGKFLKATQSP